MPPLSPPVTNTTDFRRSALLRRRQLGVYYPSYVAVAPPLAKAIAPNVSYTTNVDQIGKFRVIPRKVDPQGTRLFDQPFLTLCGGLVGTGILP